MSKKQKSGPSRTFVVLGVVMIVVFIAGLAAVMIMATAAPPP